jgi:toxin CcdB
MRQFWVYRNRNPTSEAAYPLLLNVQTDLIESLGSRVVVPLAPADTFKHKIIDRLMPTLQIDGTVYVLLTVQISGMFVKDIGAEVADLSDQRQVIMAALDMLISGI